MAAAGDGRPNGVRDDGADSSDRSRPSEHPKHRATGQSEYEVHGIASGGSRHLFPCYSCDQSLN
jgi:hypothetical protein